MERPTLTNKQYVLPFILVTTLFFLWGFARAILDVLNKHFQNALDISMSQSSLIQVTTYLGYFIMAIPAGWFINRHGYRTGVIFGLMLFGVGSLLFIPGAYIEAFPAFLLALFIIGCGLVCLETAANPYVTELGAPETATSRLNFSQSFNGLGSLFATLVVGQFFFSSSTLGGSVRVFGMDTTDEQQLLDIRRTVGMVFQNPDNQMVANVVEEDVAFAPENLGVPSAEIRKRVDDALKAVGMYEYRTHAPHLLSGGQKQRIAIAGVIAMQPRCIVLDEPTAMLDPHGREEVLRTIEDLNKNHGITVILITHHMTEAIRADRVLVMEKGNIIADGTPKEVFLQVELLKQAGLDVPVTTQLLFELNKSGCNLPLDALSTEECAQALYDLLKA